MYCEYASQLIELSIWKYILCIFCNIMDKNNYKCLLHIAASWDVEKRIATIIFLSFAPYLQSYVMI